MQNPVDQRTYIGPPQAFVVRPRGLDAPYWN